MVLAELGADVVKVENVRAGDAARNQSNKGVTFYAWNRSKRSIALDLKTAEGIAVFARMVRRADVVVDNYASGVLARLGMDYDWGQEVNPGIVYCSIKGFLPGPDGSRPYLDELAQMESGLAYLTGPPGHPLRAAPPIIDISGGVYAALGIVAALHRRQTTGVGEHIHTGLFETAVFAMHQDISRAQLTQALPQPRASLDTSAVGQQMSWGVYNLFATKDERKIFIAVVTDRQWHALCTLLELDDLLDDPTLRTNRQRTDRREHFLGRIRDVVRTHQHDELAALLHSSGIPYAPVNNPADVLDNPHMVEQEYLRTFDVPEHQGLRLPALPVVLAGSVRPTASSPPRYGEHTDDVLRDVGYTQDEIAALKERGVARSSERMLDVDT